MPTTSALLATQERIYTVVVWIAYALMVLAATGMSVAAPHLLQNLDYYLRIYMCLFLLWRFHPFPLWTAGNGAAAKNKRPFSELDRSIAFSAGVFMLTTTVLNQYLIAAERAVWGALAPFWAQRSGWWNSY